ncbi:RHS repeat-associated core domain-containing protein [Paraburkholderia rhizosphaerae]|uniref:RHS repeat-associated protein n=1 Tax=Paraburkholderia rhizosphaerae TaxID=480658 RepID=A0A4R8LDS3_9BURK|nr:RHS repeat-associated core domain-containing protein [Paraburkholderia rhizosphaerae]TDY40250.1 RHS repeat-associated protein [Paraburkholderia rhizosphaerae]
MSSADQTDQKDTEPESNGFMAAMDGVAKATEAAQDAAPALGPSISTPSAKHFDVQLGIDIHTYATPVPGPLPTPHIAMVFDPFDYIPVIGGTVHVNGVKRGNAGTGGVVAHVPFGVWAPPIRVPAGPQFDNEIFMGSKTVLADGEPFSRATMPVLDCNAVGVVPPLRIRKVKVNLSPVLPTAMNISTPGGVTVGGPSTVNMTAMLMKGAMSAVGKGLKKLRKVEGVSTRLENLGKRFKEIKKKAFKGLPNGFFKCKVLKAEPVDIRDGSVDVAQQDFTITGRLPLSWPRHYASHRCDEPGFCGQGWRTPADLRLEVDDDGIVVLSGPHLEIFFPKLPEAPGIEHAVKEWRDGARLYRVDGAQGGALHVRVRSELYIFPDTGTLRAPYVSQRRRLRIGRIQDLCGNAWHFEWEDGYLRRIVESGRDGLRGRELDVQSARDGGIASIALYDPMTRQTHPLVRYVYDDVGNLFSASDALDAPRSYRYIGHYLTRHTDRLGQAFYYEYDQAWRVVHAWGDGGLHDYRFIYRPALRETEVIDSRGHVSLIRFDEDNLPVSEIDPLGGVTTYRYDECGHTTEIIDPTGLSTRFEYDENGNETAVTLPDGSCTRVSFDRDSNPLVMTDACGRSWKQEWDTRGLPLSQADPLGAVSRYTWDEHGQLREHVNARGAMTKLAFNWHGYLCSVTNALGHEEKFEHDARGCLLTRTNALDQRSAYAYDRKGRLLWARKPDGTGVNIEYDAEDHPIAYIDEGGEHTRLEYAGTGKLTALLGADGNRTRYVYDTEEQLATIVNQNGETWRLIRDPLGRIVEEIDYWGQSTRYQYDAKGCLHTRIDPLGQVIAYETDRLGRITRKSLSDPDRQGQQIHECFRYDASGALIEMSNAHRRVVRRFDDAGRLIEEKQDSFSVNYSYDEIGQCVERTTSAGNRLVQGFDLLGQLVGVTLNDQAPVMIERDALGRATREQLGVGLARAFQYDSMGRLSAQSVMRDEAPVFSMGYQYDAVGNLTRRRDSEWGVDAYRYDPVGRLLEHIDPAGKISRFVTDAAGNHLRTRIREPKREVRQDDDARLEAWRREGEHDGRRYVFDAAGNLRMREPVVPGKGERALYLRWDANHRLIESRCGDQVTRYGYDAAGRRAFKRNPAHTTWFFWDGDALLAEVRQDNDAADRLCEGQRTLRYGVTPPPSVGREAQRLYREDGREYVYYPGTFHPFAVVEGGCRGKAVYHYHTDPNGCPVRLTDGRGEVVWAAGYDGWGGVGRVYREGVEQAIRLQGQYFDRESGLHYNRYRYFDPNTGSFISQDPIGLAGGTNPYQFAPNVLTWVDPLGLTCETKLRAENYRASGNVGKKRNIATSDFEINGRKGTADALSGRNTNDAPFVKIPDLESRKFSTFDVGHSREFDSEVKIFEHIANEFPTTATGRIDLYSELPICDSCSSVINQFREMFPGIEVNVQWG